MNNILAKEICSCFAAAFKSMLEMFSANGLEDVIVQKAP